MMMFLKTALRKTVPREHSSFPGRISGRFVGLLLGVLLAAPGWAADPFYTRLLEEGTSAYARNELPLAVERLRIACFGLLEEPVALGGCLTRLAVAQATNDDREGFVATFDRLLEIEQRFEAYSTARIDTALRRELENAVERWIPPEKIAPFAIFGPTATRLFEARIVSLPPEARREALEARIVAKPSEVRWRLLLASLELETERPAAALEVISGLAPEVAALAEARCLEGRALAAQGACAAALAHLARCQDPHLDPRAAEATLGCHARLEQWVEAEALLARLPEAQKEQTAIRRLARDIRKGLREAARAQPSPISAPAVTEGAPVAEGAEPVRQGLEPALRARLEEARSVLGREASSQEVAAARETAKRIADAHPEIPEAQHLVAELAYRSARWQEAVDYFERGGTVGQDRPVLLFYLAISLYETGDRERAATTLRACQRHLKQTEFVRSYSEKILGGGG